MVVRKQTLSTGASRGTSSSGNEDGNGALGIQLPDLQLDLSQWQELLTIQLSNVPLYRKLFYKVFLFCTWNNFLYPWDLKVDFITEYVYGLQVRLLVYWWVWWSSSDATFVWDCVCTHNKHTNQAVNSWGLNASFPFALMTSKRVASAQHLTGWHKAPVQQSIQARA